MMINNYTFENEMMGQFNTGTNASIIMEYKQPKLIEIKDKGKLELYLKCIGCDYTTQVYSSLEVVNKTISEIPKYNYTELKAISDSDIENMYLSGFDRVDVISYTDKNQVYTNNEELNLECVKMNSIDNITSYSAVFNPTFAFNQLSYALATFKGFKNNTFQLDVYDDRNGIIFSERVVSIERALLDDRK